MVAAGTTMQLSEWAVELTFDRIPDGVLHHARRALIDHLAAVVPGASDATASTVRDYLARTSPAGEASVLGTPLRLPAPDAALANGVASHVLEVDDGFTAGSFHPGGPTISAILAAAEATDSDAETLLRAIVVGYEIACRIGAAGHPRTADHGFHNTSLVGVFGAAAGVAALHGADARTFASALGIAGSHAGGVFEFLSEGATVKKYHPGMAARNGLVSAELAIAGLTGPTTILEGERGYAAAFVRGELTEEVTTDLGTRWRAIETYLKPYPCCRHVHGPMDAVLSLRAAERIDPAEVQEIAVATYPHATRYDNLRIRNTLDAQMSMQYCLAVSLVAGAPALDHFGPRWRDDARVRELMPAVTISVGDDHAERYPKERPAEVSITTSKRRYSAEVSQPFGEPSHPLPDDGLSEKFLRLVKPVLGPDTAEQVLALAWQTACPRELTTAIASTTTEEMQP